MENYILNENRKNDNNQSDKFYRVLPNRIYLIDIN